MAIRPTIRVKLNGDVNTILQEALQSVRIGIGPAPSQAIFIVRDKTIKFDDYDYEMGDYISIDVKSQDQDNWTEILDGDIVIIRPHRSVSTQSVDLVVYDSSHQGNFSEAREHFNKGGKENKHPDFCAYATQAQEEAGTAVYWQPKDMIEFLILNYRDNAPDIPGFPEDSIRGYVDNDYFTVDTDDITEMTQADYKTEIKLQDTKILQALDRITRTMGNWTWWKPPVSGSAAHKYMPIDLSVGSGTTHTLKFAEGGANITDIDREKDATQLISKLTAYGAPNRYEFTVDNQTDYESAGWWKVGKIEPAWNSSLEAAVEAADDPQDFVEKNPKYSDVYRKYKIGQIEINWLGVWHTIPRSNRILAELLSPDHNDSTKRQKPRLEIKNNGTWEGTDIQGKWSIGRKDHTIMFKFVRDVGKNLGSRTSDYTMKEFRLTFAVEAGNGRENDPRMIAEAPNEDAVFQVERKITNNEFGREIRDSIDTTKSTPETVHTEEGLKLEYDELLAWAEEQIQHYEDEAYSTRLVLPEFYEDIDPGDLIRITGIDDAVTDWGELDEAVMSVNYTFGMSPRQVLTVGNLKKRTGRENIDKMKQEQKAIKEKQDEIERALEPPQILAGGGGGVFQEYSP